jgi:hypothetical protein
VAAGLCGLRFGVVVVVVVVVFFTPKKASSPQNTFLCVRCLSTDSSLLLTDSDVSRRPCFIDGIFFPS